jgi:hypothetical protein
MATGIDPELELEHAGRWPHYRIRRGIRAKRIGRPFVLNGHMYSDGYIVRCPDGGFTVITVAEFHAVYELTEAHD